MKLGGIPGFKGQTIMSAATLIAPSGKIGTKQVRGKGRGSNWRLTASSSMSDLATSSINQLRQCDKKRLFAAAICTTSRFPAAVES